MDIINKISALSSKGFKATLAIALVLVIWTGITDDRPQYVRDAQTDLFLGYHEHIYQNLHCESLEADDDWVVFCHPRDHYTGGLFHVVEGGRDYALYALNGKAQTHAGKIGLYAPPHSITAGPSELIEMFKEQ